MHRALSTAAVSCADAATQVAFWCQKQELQILLAEAVYAPGPIIGGRRKGICGGLLNAMLAHGLCQNQCAELTSCESAQLLTYKPCEAVNLTQAETLHHRARRLCMLLNTGIAR